MRTAIVGTGGIARAHAKAVVALADRLELAAAVDTDPTRLADFQETYGVPNGYRDVAEMLKAQRPDVVQICSPPGSHVELSIACLEAGARVLCEKPLAGSLAELDRIQLYLLGDWTTVRALIATVESDIDNENVSLAIVEFANGALVSITNSAVSPRQESYLRLDFSRATVELTTLYGYTNANWRFSIAPDANDAERTAFARWSTLPDEVATSQTSQLRAMLDDMQVGRRPLVSGAPDRGTIEFLISLYKSACTGENVHRGSIAPDDPFYNGMAHVFARKVV